MGHGVGICVARSGVVYVQVERPAGKSIAQIVLQKFAYSLADGDEVRRDITAS
jgi:hypothetical protein